MKCADEKCSKEIEEGRFGCKECWKIYTSTYIYVPRGTYGSGTYYKNVEHMQEYAEQLELSRKEYQESNWLQRLNSKCVYIFELNEQIDILRAITKGVANE